MSNVPAPVQEVARLLDLVPYLSTHSHISLHELASEFGISQKEMARELTALSMCGLPGYTPYELIEVFFDSGYVTINNHDALDIPRALTSLELASLLIGLELLRDGLESIGESLQRAKFTEKVDSLITQLSSQLGDRIEVGENPESALLSSLQRAIARRSRVEISYHSPIRDYAEKRVVSPLSIYTEKEFSYLSAYCFSSRGYRNFRLDRILLTLDLESELASGGDGFPVELGPESGEAVLPSLSITAQADGRRRAISELFKMDSAAIGKDGQFLHSVYSAEWVTRAVAAYSPDLKVVEPSEIRVAAREHLQNILALYRS